MFDSGCFVIFVVRCCFETEISSIDFGAICVIAFRSIVFLLMLMLILMNHDVKSVVDL